MCGLTKHDGLHAFWERLQSGIPIDCMLACDGKRHANVKSDHNSVFNGTTNDGKRVKRAISSLDRGLIGSTLSYRPIQAGGSEQRKTFKRLRDTALVLSPRVLSSIPPN